jgi:hypothetical protein
VARGCFAFAGRREPVFADSPYSPGFYGNVHAGIVSTLYWSERKFVPEDLEPLLGRLADLDARYRLILVAHGQVVAPLGDHGRMADLLRPVD